MIYKMIINNNPGNVIGVEQKGNKYNFFFNLRTGAADASQRKMVRFPAKSKTEIDKDIQNFEDNGLQVCWECQSFTCEHIESREEKK